MSLRYRLQLFGHCSTSVHASSEQPLRNRYRSAGDGGALPSGRQEDYKTFVESAPFRDAREGSILFGKRWKSESSPNVYSGPKQHVEYFRPVAWFIARIKHEKRSLVLRKLIEREFLEPTLEIRNWAINQVRETKMS